MRKIFSLLLIIAVLLGSSISIDAKTTKKKNKAHTSQSSKKTSSFNKTYDGWPDVAGHSYKGREARLTSGNFEYYEIAFSPDGKKVKDIHHFFASNGQHLTPTDDFFVTYLGNGEYQFKALGGVDFGVYKVSSDGKILNGPYSHVYKLIK